MIAYAEDLADLTAEQLDAACKEARRTSEFMPVSAAIRAAHEKMRTTGTVFLGPPLLAYTEEEEAKYCERCRPDGWVVTNGHAMRCDHRKKQ